MERDEDNNNKNIHTKIIIHPPSIDVKKKIKINKEVIKKYATQPYKVKIKQQEEYNKSEKIKYTPTE